MALAAEGKQLFLEGTVYVSTYSTDATVLLIQGEYLDSEKISRPILKRHVPNSDGTRKETKLRVSPSQLLSLVVVPEDASAYAVKRGQCWVEAGIYRGASQGDGSQHAILFDDYIYKGHFPGWPPFYRTDPTSDNGHLHWVQEADDEAGNVTTTVNLAATNLRRVIRGVIVKYHQAGGGDITLTITLRDIATAAGPTGWTIESDTWQSPTLTLGANQEGLIHIAEHGFVSLNDAGTLSYADNTTAPNPFPLTLEEGETGDLLIAAGSGASGDDYDVWVQYEDWIEP